MITQSIVIIPPDTYIGDVMVTVNELVPQEVKQFMDAEHSARNLSTQIMYLDPGVMIVREYQNQEVIDRYKSITDLDRLANELIAMGWTVTITPSNDQL